MKIFVLEGYNDVIFVESILNHCFNKSNVPKAFDNENIRDGMKRLMNTLRNHKEYNYYKNNFGIIVYGDNGKRNVISKVIPRLCYDLIGKNPPRQTEFLVILDEDGETLNNTVTRIKNEIINRNIPDSEVLDINSNDIKIQFNFDHSYWIYIQVCLIPRSLEYQIVHKAIETNISLNERRQRELLNDDPHKALKEIASLLRISKEELIQQSVFDNWFLDSRWHDEVVQRIRNFINK